MFAWNAYEAPGVDLTFIYHHLNVNHPSHQKSNHLGVHLKTILMLSRMRLLKRCFTLNG